MLLVRYLCIVFVVIFICLISRYFKYDNSFNINNELIYEENKILKRELEDISKLNYEDYVIGRVLYRDIYSFYEEIVVNLGSDKVSVGDAVINEYGLVGVIYKVSDSMCYVKLLSSDYNVSVLVNGVYGNLNNGVITLLDKYSDIKEGDLVYTSNYGSLEEGIYVGRVSKVYYDEDLLGKNVKVELVDNKNLNYVGVIKKIK